MKSRVLPSFWQQFAKLPAEIQRHAYRSYRLWRTDPSAHGLYFKRVNRNMPIYSVRIGRSHRALGVLTGDTILWYFIGDHDAYERELKSL